MTGLHAYFEKREPLGESALVGVCRLTPEELQEFLWEHPGCLGEREVVDGRLVLHAALDCCNATPEGLVRMLLEAHPQAVSVPDMDGLLPLHYACDNGCHPGVLRLLLEAYPEALFATDHEGWTPLHHACYPDPDLPPDSTSSAVTMVSCLLETATQPACLHRLAISKPFNLKVHPPPGLSEDLLARWEHLLGSDAQQRQKPEILALYDSTTPHKEWTHPGRLSIQ